MLIRRSNPDARIVLVTVHSDPLLVERGLAAGALGYVLKDAAGDELVPAVHAALGGERFVSRALGGRERRDEMSAMTEHAIPAEEPDFSLVLGGPLFQLFRRAHLSGDALELLRRRVLVIAWRRLGAAAAVVGGRRPGAGRRASGFPSSTTSRSTSAS